MNMNIILLNYTLKCFKTPFEDNLYIKEFFKEPSSESSKINSFKTGHFLYYLLMIYK
jgi:hypothetical protein